MRKHQKIEIETLQKLRRIFPKTKCVTVGLAFSGEDFHFSTASNGRSIITKLDRELVFKAVEREAFDYLREMVLNLLNITPEEFATRKSWQIQAPPEYYEERKRTRITRGQERRARQLKIFNGG